MDSDPAHRDIWALGNHGAGGPLQSLTFKTAPQVMTALFLDTQGMESQWLLTLSLSSSWTTANLLLCTLTILMAPSSDVTLLGYH